MLQRPLLLRASERRCSFASQVAQAASFIFKLCQYSIWASVSKLSCKNRDSFHNYSLAHKLIDLESLEKWWGLLVQVRDTCEPINLAGAIWVLTGTKVGWLWRQANPVKPRRLVSAGNAHVFALRQRRFAYLAFQGQQVGWPTSVLWANNDHKT